MKIARSNPVQRFVWIIFQLVSYSWQFTLYWIQTLNEPQISDCTDGKEMLGFETEV